MSQPTAWKKWIVNLLQKIMQVIPLSTKLVREDICILQNYYFFMVLMPVKVLRGELGRWYFYTYHNPIRITEKSTCI